MPECYQVQLEKVSEGVATIRLSFGLPAENDQLVRDSLAAIAELSLPGGKGIKFTGPASLPVAMALSHAVAHLYGYVACFDPKLGKYVVAISHDPTVRPGDLIE